MARLKQVEVLRQRISEVTGMPIGDIDAQNSRYFAFISGTNSVRLVTLIKVKLCFRDDIKKRLLEKLYFPIECTDSFYRELLEIASALGVADTALFKKMNIFIE